MKIRTLALALATTFAVAATSLPLLAGGPQEKAPTSIMLTLEWINANPRTAKRMTVRSDVGHPITISESTATPQGKSGRSVTLRTQLRPGGVVTLEISQTTQEGANTDSLSTVCSIRNKETIALSGSTLKVEKSRESHEKLFMVTPTIIED